MTAPPIELTLLIASTRPQRVGPVIADWVRNQVPTDLFAITVVDLAEVGLPLLDEPEPAATGIYRHEHTRHWADLVRAAQALVIVTPEYNAGYPAGLKNAIDYLYAEWEGRPVALVGYGWRGAASSREQLATVFGRVKARLVGGVGVRFADHLDGPPSPTAAVQADDQLTRETAALFAALAATAGTVPDTP
ncbi:MAG: NAD(P)H-dependent oxidoreductase [Actinomycetales bacterium]|nr:NAD(P)H-dependent oxidoreductase [Actinomycetales bacterium]